MTRSANAQTVETMFGAILAGDIETLFSVVHPDVAVFEPESLPDGGVHKGRDAFIELFGQIAGPNQLELEDVRTIDGDDIVAGQMTVMFTSRISGASIRMPYVEVYEFEDGLIRSIHVYPQDTKRLAAFMTVDD
jgi:ketosteroid isomerase-like protein